MQQRKITNKIKNLSKLTKINKIVVTKPAGISYLNLVALGANIPTHNTAQLLASLIANYNCNIITSSIIELGQDLAFNASISGKWNNIAKLEKSLTNLDKKYPIYLYFKRNSTVENISYINYLIQTTTINKPGILNKLLQFFNKEAITIKEANINSNNYNNIVTIEIQIKIPTDFHISSLRERFLTYCDELNLDASLEPL